MKLNILTHSYYPGSTADAVRLVSITQMLQAVYEINVMVSGKGQAIGSEKVTSLEHQTNFTSNKWVRLFREIALSFTFIANLRKLKRSEKLIISSPPYVTFLLVRVFCALTKRQFIHDLRDPYPEIMTSSRLIQALIYWVERRLLSSTVEIWVTTESWKQKVQKNLKFDKITVIPNGHSFADVQRKNKPDAPVLVVGVLGNIGEFQDIELLCKIIESCLDDPRIHFEIYGSGSRMKELTSKIEGFSNCSIKGRVPHQQVGEVLQSFDLGLSIRKDSAINEYVVPVRTFEFIGMGVPLIIVPCSSFGTQLEQQGLAYCFKGGDIELISEKIHQLVDDREQLLSMSERQWNHRQQFERQLAKSDIVQGLSKF